MNFQVNFFYDAYHETRRWRHLYTAGWGVTLTFTLPKRWFHVHVLLTAVFQGKVYISCDQTNDVWALKSAFSHVFICEQMQLLANHLIGNKHLSGWNNKSKINYKTIRHICKIMSIQVYEFTWKKRLLCAEKRITIILMPHSSKHIFSHIHKSK